MADRATLPHAAARTQGSIPCPRPRTRTRIPALSGTGDIKANDVRILAIKAGQLTDKTYGGATKSAGTGIPVIASVHRNAASGVKGANGGSFAYQKVASLSVPAGKWALVATAWVMNYSAPGGTILRCKLVAGASKDSVQLTYPLGVGNRDGFELSTVHAFSSTGVATLLCGQGASSDQLEIQSVKITAVKAGTLTSASL